MHRYTFLYIYVYMYMHIHIYICNTQKYWKHETFSAFFQKIISIFVNNEMILICTFFICSFSTKTSHRNANIIDGLVSLFNGISTFVGYLMPNPFS